MPSIKKKLADAIINAVQGRRLEVPLTQPWLEIHKEFAIGTRRGKTLQLSLDDHLQLRSLMKNAAGFDPLTETPNYDSRLLAAATVIDEKWGGAAGAGRLVNVYRHATPINTIRGECTVPPGCGLFLDACDLLLSPSLPIVIVENLMAFLSIEAFLLPVAWKDALFVYRGHDEITSGVSAMLARVPEGTSVAVMSDYDPAGLRIALSTTAATGWLGPALDATLGPSNSELFEKQAQYLSGLQEEGPEGLRAVIARLIRERVAFTQERMAALRVQLAFHPFGRLAD